MTTTHRVLLFYKYVAIADPIEVMKAQRALCEKLQLKGRILIATEGINGTVEGTIKDTDDYIVAMQKSIYFQNISFKKSGSTGASFRKLVVKVRPEVVTAGMTHLNLTHVTGKYITAEELHAWFAEKKEFYIVDMRNDYEFSSGHFEGSIFSGMHHFFELDSVLAKLQHLKDKTIVTVCTGGIRCEKASGFLVTNGFRDVYQLQNGIHSYMETYPNEHFKGKLYVFDKRLLIGFNTDDPRHEVIGKCLQCNITCERYVNCGDDTCHYHYLCCENCQDSETGLAFCTKQCKENYLLGKARVNSV